MQVCGFKQRTHFSNNCLEFKAYCASRLHSSTPLARPQAQQAAYLSISSRHVDSPRCLGGAYVPERLARGAIAVAHLLFWEPGAALGMCPPVGMCPPAQPQARGSVGVRRRAARRASRSGPCTRPRPPANKCTGRRLTGRPPALPAAARRACGGRGAAPGPRLSTRTGLHAEHLKSFMHWVKPCHAFCMHPALRAACGSLTRAGGWRARRSQRRAPARGTLLARLMRPTWGPGG